jgi:hypothetical protein
MYCKRKYNLPPAGYLIITNTGVVYSYGKKRVAVSESQAGGCIFESPADFKDNSE